MAARKIDRRTLGICACIALIGACAAGLLAWALLDDSSTSSATPSEVTLEARTEDLFTTELDWPDGSAPTNLQTLGGGKPMVVNFWQATCEPCIAEMPILQQASLDNPGVVFVGIAVEQQVEPSAKFAKDTGITYPWVLDPVGDAFHYAKGAGMPTTVLIDGQGEVVDTHTGAYDSLGQLQASIDEHLG